MILSSFPNGMTPINGMDKTYTVASGYTVNTGDFVKIVNNQIVPSNIRSNIASTATRDTIDGVAMGSASSGGTIVIRTIAGGVS